MPDFSVFIAQQCLQSQHSSRCLHLAVASAQHFYKLDSTIPSTKKNKINNHMYRVTSITQETVAKAGIRFIPWGCAHTLITRAVVCFIHYILPTAETKHRFYRACSLLLHNDSSSSAGLFYVLHNTEDPQRTLCSQRNHTQFPCSHHSHNPPQSLSFHLTLLPPRAGCTGVTGFPIQFLHLIRPQIAAAVSSRNREDSFERW